MNGPYERRPDLLSAVEAYDGVMAVIGDPIGHSLSPLLQNTIIKTLGRSETYLAVPVSADELEEFVRGAKTLGLAGFNLTMPHKISVLPYLSNMTREAQRAGSVNSVRIRQGRLEGHCTDGIGLRRALEDMNLRFQGSVVTVLGAGGAARAIAKTAADSGAKAVRVVNRTLSKAEQLCVGETTMTAHGLSEREAVLGDTDILINTTPVGMEGVDGGGDFAFLAALKPEAAAVDCIYAPAMTPFMAAAKKLGHPVCNGIGMLVYQAIYAYGFFRDVDFSEETVTELGKKLLEVSGVDPKGENRKK